VRYLSLAEVLELHRRIIEQTGGASGLRDLGALESALAQPAVTFDAQDLYPTLSDKAAALGFSLIQNHPFLDGNKRVGHAALEALLILNGSELHSSVDEAEQTIVDVAAGRIDRRGFADWVRRSVRPMAS